MARLRHYYPALTDVQTWETNPKWSKMECEHGMASLSQQSLNAFNWRWGNCLKFNIIQIKYLHIGWDNVFKRNLNSGNKVSKLFAISFMYLLHLYGKKSICSDICIQRDTGYQKLIEGPSFNL